MNQTTKQNFQNRLSDVEKLEQAAGFDSLVNEALFYCSYLAHPEKYHIAFDKDKSTEIALTFLDVIERLLLVETELTNTNKSTKTELS